MTITDFETVIGLLNGMIGGSILILPLQGVIVGYGAVIIITLFITLICGYTANLLLKHLGQAKTMNQAIESHFNGNKRYSQIYNIIIGFSSWPWCATYFHLLILQIQGLFGIHNNQVLPLVMCFVSIILTLVLKKYDLGEKALAYGVVSIVSYMIFLTWALESAPSGPVEVPMFGQGYSNYGTILMGALSIHDFIVQVMIHNPNRRSYSKLIVIIYIIGCAAYIYMGLGSFSIVNRIPLINNPQVISQFFQPNEWQVHLIQAIYLVHLLTAMPEFILISKVRMFQAFGYEQVQDTIEWHEVWYTFMIVFFCYLLYVLQLRVNVILQITGSIMSLVYVIVIPIVIHLKCVYIDRSTGYIEQIVQNSCQCDIVYPSKEMKYLELGWMVITVAAGLYVTVYTLGHLGNG